MGVGLTITSNLFLAIAETTAFATFSGEDVPIAEGAFKSASLSASNHIPVSEIKPGQITEIPTG